MHNKYTVDLTKVSVSPEFEAYLQSFQRSLLAANRSHSTIKIYLTSVRTFARYLAAKELPQKLSEIKRQHVESFIVDTLATHSAHTGAGYFRGLQQFFKWLLEDEEVKVSPMEKMVTPHVPEAPPDVLGEDFIRKLFRTCEGNDFMARRDTAIIRMLVDTGLRLSEISNLKLEDVNLDLNVAYVIGKGSRPRACPFGKKTTLALDKYLRSRAKHKHADDIKFWLGREGPITKWAIPQMLDSRTDQAGLPHIHPHLFRHTFAHMWLDGGGQEGDLRMIGGWNSSEVMRRYGKKLASDRARESHKRLSPGDRL